MRHGLTCLATFLLISGVSTPELAAQAPPDSSFTEITARYFGGDQVDTGSNVGAPGTADQWVLLDRPIDRDEYIVGPGDVVNVAIFGEVPLQYRLVVAPEGTLVLPTIGVVNVLNLTINEAERRVRAEILRYFRSVDVSLTLAQIRGFKVFLVGDVEAPGVRTAGAATRVSEVAPAANSRGIVYRNISLRRASGATARVDLARFFQTGDLSHNPTLREGDVIVVPEIDQTVSVFGRVSQPGTYAYMNGESLAGVLALANGAGGFPADAADSVRVSRLLQGGASQVTVFSRAEATGAAGEAFLLEPFDAVFVAEISNFMQQHTATILGEVERPGAYPIEPNRTTVRELIQEAGGFTAEASLVDAVLRRQPRGEIAADTMSILNSVPADYLSEYEQRVLVASATGNPSNVIIDFERLVSDESGAYDQVLQAGDLIVIPERRNEVSILGAVVQPGSVQYVPGQGIGYFVGLAGGFTSQADNEGVVVIKARQGTQVPQDDVRSIEPGDRIVVPFRRPRTALERLQTVQSVIGTVSGIVLTILGIANLL